MSKIIILNGPIGCGKDTIGMAFANSEGYELTCFKEPMFRIAANTMGYAYDEFMDMYRDREWKDSPNEKLNGHTVRELMIHISEVYIKPFVGPDYFGQQAAEYIRQRPWQRTFIFADGGFPMEIDVLANAGHEVVLVHMYRDGCTFEGDSRSYVLTNTVPRIYTLNNNGTIAEAVEELGRIVDHYDDSRTPSDSEEDEAPRRRPSPTRRNRGWVMPELHTFGERTPARNATVRAAASTQSQFAWDSNGEPVIARADASVGEAAQAATWYSDAGETTYALASSPVLMDEIEPVSEGIAG